MFRIRYLIKKYLLNIIPSINYKRHINLCPTKATHNSYCSFYSNLFKENMVLTKIPATQNEVALSYHRVRGLYFLAAIFARSI